jgi:L-asparagine transporter-like permease
MKLTVPTRPVDWWVQLGILIMAIGACMMSMLSAKSMFEVTTSLALIAICVRWTFILISGCDSEKGT